MTDKEVTDRGHAFVAVLAAIAWAVLCALTVAGVL